MPAPFEGGSYSVAEEVANGDEVGTTQIAHERKLDIATIFRWIVRGLPAADGGRVRLEAVKRGKTWLTSRAALRRFFLALPTNAAVDAPQSNAVPDVARCLEARTGQRRLGKNSGRGTGFETMTLG